MYQESPHGTESNASTTPGRIWRDTSEEQTYGNYLDNAQGNTPHDMQLRPTFAGARMTGAGPGAHPDIAVGLLEDDGSDGGAAAVAAKKSYSGRKRVWPGALFLLVVCLAGTFAVTYFGVQQYNAAQKQQAISEEFTSLQKPKKALPLKVCRVPNYVTDKGKLYAIGGSKDEKHEVHFTGINWSGMENKEGVPHGLAAQQTNLDAIAQGLNDMEINAVRLPLNAKMVLDDSAPDVNSFVSRTSADLFAVTTYVDMIKKIVQGLARKQVAVLLDLHKIDPEYAESTSEELWYTDEYPEATIIEMFEKLAKELCNEKHYNIIGVDIKNEPAKGCWPAKDSDSYCPKNRNWPRAVERIGDAILKVCPNWLIVVEGLAASNIVKKINGKEVTYSDWLGASLQNATANPIKLSIENKIVFAPHFYSPSVYPSSYFFAEQKALPSGEVSVTEYPMTAEGNKSLETAVTTVLDEAFGEILDKGTAPVFYGEFGGIYGSKELLADKTSTRVIDIVIKYAEKKGMIGGFSWALNPDGNYDFNDVYVGYSDKLEPWKFGLYEDEKWDGYNEDYAAGLRQLKGNGIIPCFDRIVSGSSAAGDASTDGSSDVAASAIVGSTDGTTADTAGTVATTTTNTTTATTTAK
ncbi:hypothetical protein Poli38472_011426 [Pythium oligandrum]|uniref:Glycoside hydrolase family 5 domain-containing protein n=1 Tax=Pythium oligandrum TaxID=41045 RepID=A0A8K1FJ51_PYTOL|nr:hypothetical protein Poli38472_011426 [Pythium oligandrum]|eukprot:TMW64546.1 hypothetical protein Poli38472_011426 [Pythium oligandrum]